MSWNLSFLEAVLQLWKAKLLILVGKDVLVKSTLSSISIFTLSTFLLPSSLTRDLEKIIQCFWWGNDTSRRKLHWASWENICKSKMEGGVGVRDLWSFILALLAKLARRLVAQPDSLVASILLKKYCGNIYKVFQFLNKERGLLDLEGYS